MIPERYDTVVIGGGQAGLTAGYYLSRQQGSVRDPRRERTRGRRVEEALGLASPVHTCDLQRASGLPACPGRPGRIPRRTSWPTTSRTTRPASSCRFRPASRSSASRRTATASSSRRASRAFEAANVIVATGAHRIARVPELRGRPRSEDRAAAFERVPQSRLSSRTATFSSSAPGTPGAEIALELSQGHACHDRGTEDRARSPCRTARSRRRLGFRVFRFFGHRVLRVDTRLGRKLGPKVIAHGDPLIRTRIRDLAAAGVEHVPRVVGVRERPAGARGRPGPRRGERRLVHWASARTSAGSTCRSSTATGSRAITAASSSPSRACRFLGLVFQYSLSSDVLPDRGRDARYLAEHIARRRKEAPAPAQALAAA